MSKLQAREFWVRDSEMKECPDGKSRVGRIENPEIDGVNSGFTHYIEANPALSRIAELEKIVVHWNDGYPLQREFKNEWFLAITKFGDKVVLRALPEEWSYQFTTADETYMKAENVVKWALFPDSQWKTPNDVIAELQSQLKIAEAKLSKASDALISISEYWNGGTESANDAIIYSQGLAFDTVFELNAITAETLSSIGEKK